MKYFWVSTTLLCTMAIAACSSPVTAPSNHDLPPSEAWIRGCTDSPILKQVEDLELPVEFEDLEKEVVKKEKERPYGLGPDACWADLKGINLKGKRLFWYFFNWANLERANLENADLKEAFLLGANLKGANLKGTNLQDSLMLSTGFQFKGMVREKEPSICNILNRVTIDQDTKLPDGVKLAWFSNPFHYICEDDTGVYPETSKDELFYQNGNIFIQAGSKVKQLTHSGFVVNSKFTPDKKSVIFTRALPSGECMEGELSHLEELWIIDSEGNNERLVLSKEYKSFTQVEWSPDGKIIYFSALGGVVSDRIYSVSIDGKNARYIASGISFWVLEEPLPQETKNYLKSLDKDDWRISPKSTGLKLVQKALNDEVIGYLIVKRTEVIFDQQGESQGRHWWDALVSPDGQEEVPLGESEN